MVTGPLNKPFSYNMFSVLRPMMRDSFGELRLRPPKLANPTASPSIVGNKLPKQKLPGVSR